MVSPTIFSQSEEDKKNHRSIKKSEALKATDCKVHTINFLTKFVLRISSRMRKL